MFTRYAGLFKVYTYLFLYENLDFLLLDVGSIHSDSGWSGGAMALGKLPVLGRPTIWMIVGQGPPALAVGAGVFFFFCFFF